MGIMHTPGTIGANLPTGQLSGGKHGTIGNNVAKARAKRKAQEAAASAALKNSAAANRQAAAERGINRRAAGEQQIQEMHGQGAHETTGAYVSWMKDSEKKAAKAQADKMKARTVKANATRAENSAKKRVQALGYNDTHKETLGRGSYIGVENFLKNEASNQARAEWRKKNRPTVVKPGKSPKTATAANFIPAPSTPAPGKNGNLSSKQL
jgi:hypothetical protein